MFSLFFLVTIVYVDELLSFASEYHQRWLQCCMFVCYYAFFTVAILFMASALFSKSYITITLFFITICSRICGCMSGHDSSRLARVHMWRQFHFSQRKYACVCACMSVHNSDFLSRAQTAHLRHWFLFTKPNCTFHGSHVQLCLHLRAHDWSCLSDACAFVACVSFYGILERTLHSGNCACVCVCMSAHDSRVHLRRVFSSTGSWSRLLSVAIVHAFACA